MYLTWSDRCRRRTCTPWRSRERCRPRPPQSMCCWWRWSPRTFRSGCSTHQTHWHRSRRPCRLVQRSKNKYREINIIELNSMIMMNETAYCIWSINIRDQDTNIDWYVEEVESWMNEKLENKYWMLRKLRIHPTAQVKIPDKCQKVVRIAGEILPSAVHSVAVKQVP